MAQTLVTLLFLIASVVGSDSNVTKSCYFPNGTIASDKRPGINFFVCNPKAEHSPCCIEDTVHGTTDECTTNGFCKFQGDGNLNWYWGHACTDPTWQSKDCPNHCMNSSTGLGNMAAELDTAQSGSWLVFQCSDTTYCCAYHQGSNNEYDIKDNHECCGNSSRRFDAGKSNYLAGLNVTTSSVPSIPSATKLISSTDHSNKSDNIALGVGIGIGVPIVLASLAAVTWCVFRRRRRGTTSGIRA